MKKIIAITLISLSALVVLAQTNSLTTDLGNVLGDVGLSTNPTNWAVVPFVGAGTHGKLAAGLLGIENVNQNVGVVGGIDHLWFGGKSGDANLVSGGVTLKAVIYPVRQVCSVAGINLATNTWAYSLKATPFALALVGTPMNGTSNNGGLAGIYRGGADLDVYSVHGWNIGIGIDYGNRTGAGAYSGNYIDFFAAISKGF